MPEGDTVHAVAAVLGPMLVAAPLRALVVAGRPVPLGPEARVEAVDVHGKHLLVTLRDGERAPVLRVHLGMGGAWHRYRPGERWPLPADLAGVVLHTDRWVAVCFRPHEAVLYRSAAAAFATAPLAALGPDLLAPTFDVALALARARALAAPDAAIADVLLDQRVAAGLGNAYKSELLFLAGLDPWTPLAALPDDAVRALYTRGRALLTENLTLGGLRTTTRAALGGFGAPGSAAAQRREAAAQRLPDPGAPPARGRALPAPARAFVYRRAGRPCRRCGLPVRAANQGPHGRRTFWCPRCQPARPAPTP